MILSCKICGAKTREIRHNKLKTSYSQCKLCEFISKDENAIISSQEELKIYNYHNNSIENEKYVAYFKDFLDNAVLPHFNGARFGLDFGSGPSPVLAMILERDYGFDMDIHDLFYSPEKPYKDKQYNLITCTEVIEHLKNPLAYFRLFKELLHDGGILAIMTLFHPNNDIDFMDWFYVRDRSHISFYTPRTLEMIGELIGLKLIYHNGHRHAILIHQ
jgi:hypothetical protein